MSRIGTRIWRGRERFLASNISGRCDVRFCRLRCVQLKWCRSFPGGWFSALKRGRLISMRHSPGSVRLYVGKDNDKTVILPRSSNLSSFPGTSSPPRHGCQITCRLKPALCFPLPLRSSLFQSPPGPRRHGRRRQGHGVRCLSDSQTFLCVRSTR